MNIHITKNIKGRNFRSTEILGYFGGCITDSVHTNRAIQYIGLLEEAHTQGAAQQSKYSMRYPPKKFKTEVPYTMDGNYELIALF